MANDFYEVLGVSRTATQDEIKRAYRKLAHKHHPDKEGGDEEKFKEINEAYQVLGNENKRSQYDQFGHAFNGAGGQGPFGFDGENVNINFEDLGGFGDIFETFFGGGQRTRTQTRRGEDITVDVTISFAESAKGLKKEMEHRVYQTCSHCRGNLAEPGTPIVDCATCGGKGHITHTRQTPLGMFTQRSVCTVCRGEGKKAEVPCTVCRGQGRELKERKLVVDIPAGIDDGQIIRIPGKGAAPLGGGALGDLYVTIHVQQDKHFRRDGYNVRSKANISFIDAALGTEVTIKTLEGDQALRIPPGTQPGHEVRLDHKGFPHLEGAGKGDHIVTVQVSIPKKLNRKQKQLLEELRSASKKKGLFF